MITQENIPYTADEIKAMVKTCEKYNKAFERAKTLIEKLESTHIKGFIYHILPELKESEDERIKREIVAYISELADLKNEKIPTKWLDWLEKQGEQKAAVYAPKFRVGNIIKSKSQQMLDARKIISIDKDCYWCEDKGCIGFAWEDDYELVEQKPSDKVEPKFKVGDWIVDDETPNDVFCVIEVLEEIYKVIDIDGDDYHIPHCKADKQFHLWTIQDAKDGDVLVDEDNNIGLYLGEKDDLYWHSCSYLGCDDCFRSVWGYHKHKNTKPATKEQRDLFSLKMKEAGKEIKCETDGLEKH